MDSSRRRPTSNAVGTVAAVVLMVLVALPLIALLLGLTIRLFDWALG